ncbi:hypothetical protein [Shinella zoogloeoides]|uniref:hypothetical protein n=1 Tax=Shinella zoogloeoides TaxID=352475 RepID=UPI00299E0CED|nr:hypothetical protein [Shinella zoogloeoides]WPE19849.1 hypothetical protein ShzoTeo12_10250 [Shinella zoogloeoides]
MTTPVSAIEKAMRDHIKVDATGLSPAVASAYVVGFDEAAKAVAEIIARQAEALQRENAELRKTLAGDHEIKPLSEDRLDEILEFQERFKMLGGAGDTASLDWATQCALINEAVLSCRARALLGGENAGN